MSRGTIGTIVLLVLAAVLVSVSDSAPRAQQKSEPEDLAIPPDVKALLEQRLEIFRQLELGVVKLQEVGRSNTLDVIAAKRERLAAELELAESRHLRLGILRRQVEAAREVEALTQHMADQQRAGQNEILRARLDRLAAEINVAREKREAAR